VTPPETEFRTPDDVLAFWFGRPGDETYGQARKVWFVKDEAFDAACRARFLATHEAAALGALDGWAADAAGALALVLALNQFPRNIFRDHPRAFATDRAALAVAERAIARGLDKDLPPFQRTFLYMPFQHAEDLAIQRRSVALFATMADTESGGKSLDYARRHLEIVERFGRFPHRNAVLGRATTPEETAFLKEPGSSF